MKFTYEAYSKLVKKIINRGYIITDYEGYHNYEKCVILRHDVDLSITKALELAKLEADMGVTSTYFVLISSPFYNVFSKKTFKEMEQIKLLGHNIGLHFDELNYSDQYYNANGGIKAAIFYEAEMLERVIGEKVKYVSMHRPSKKTLDSNYDLSPMVNSYGEKFFSEFKYISDSRRLWHDNVEKIIEQEEYNYIQILTHAFWYNQYEMSIEESIKEFVGRAITERYIDLEDNITDLKSILKMEDI